MTSNQNTRGRGLASASQETRQRVASAGGRAVSNDREHMAEIGRKGGRSRGERKSSEEE